MAEMASPPPLSLRTQILRFVLTGGFSALVDYGLLELLSTVLGLPIGLSKALSFIAGTITAYLINRRWTFDAGPSRSRFAKVMVLYGLTFAVQVGLFLIVFNSLGGHAWTKLVAFVIAQGTATIINFIVQRVWIFRIH
jgi:putative flippase GtrA